MSTAQNTKALWLAALATCFVFSELSIVQAGFFRSDGPLPWAVAFDLLCVLPGAYAWFVLRPAARPLLELTPLLIFSVACAWLLLRGVPGVQRPLHLFAAFAELFLVCALVLRVVHTLRAQADLVFQAQQQREPLVRLVALELCVVYYACIAPFRRKRAACSVGDATQVFHNHAPAQRLLLGLGVVSALEAVPVHFLLYAWSPTVAWVVLALTLYSLLWIVGAYQALVLRPVLVSPCNVLLRVGLFYTVVLERAHIARATPYAESAPQLEVLSLKFLVRPNLLFELSAPARVFGPFGRERWARRLALYVDQPAELARTLASDV